MTINSRQKGKRGELDACKAIESALGIEARRSVQYKGRADAADIETSIDELFIEVKRTERVDLWNWVAKAKADCGGKVPIILHRRSRDDWLVIVPLSELSRLCSLLEKE